MIILLHIYRPPEIFKNQMAFYKLQGIVLSLSRNRSTPLSSPRRLNLIDESHSSSFVGRFKYTFPSHLQGHVLRKTHIPMARNEDVYGEDIDRSSITSCTKSATNGKLQPPSPPPAGTTPLFPVWIRWVAGSILCLILSNWMPKWSTFLKIGGEAEGVMKEAEKVVEVVEKVAMVAEKVAEDVSDQLPDESKLKQAATLLENISKEAAKDAHLADQIIHKVDNVEHDLEDLDKLVEPLIHKIIHHKKPYL